MRDLVGRLDLIECYTREREKRVEMDKLLRHMSNKCVIGPSQQRRRYQCTLYFNMVVL